MRFIIFVIDGTSNSANGSEIAEIDNFNQNLVDHGHWVMAAGIAAPDKAKVFDNRNGEERAEASIQSRDEFFSGFWVITAENEAEAQALSSRASKACNRRVELRPFLGN